MSVPEPPTCTACGDTGEIAEYTSVGSLNFTIRPCPVCVVPNPESDDGE